MSEPDWKTSLSAAVEAAIGLNVDCGGAAGVYRVRDAVLSDIAPHIEAAYQRGLAAPRGPSEGGPRLSRRQMDVARLAAAGMTNKEIARELYITVNSVQTHMRAALEKSGARTRAQLGALLAMNGLITYSDSARRSAHALLVRQGVPLPRSRKRRERESPDKLQAHHPGRPRGGLRHERGAPLVTRLQRLRAALKERGSDLLWSVIGGAVGGGIGLLFAALYLRGR